VLVANVREIDQVMDERSVYSSGGTKPKTPSELCSPVLRAVGAEVADACVERLYQAYPELAERYGERGRRLTAEDNLWHLTFLDAAVAMDDPGRFHRYADWLVRFLGPRGLTSDHVARAFTFLGEGLAFAECLAVHEVHRQILVDLLRLTSEHVLAVGAAEGGCPRERREAAGPAMDDPSPPDST
jgi:hypothetical protein